MTVRLDNAAARRVFLDRHALSAAEGGDGRGADLQALIERLGFVQVDSVRTVERAHHMILAARRQRYRPKALDPLLERDRGVFEHWTHDASVIPMMLWPHWRLRFARDAEQLRARWARNRRSGFAETLDTVLGQIRAHGPVTSADVGRDEARSSGGWWDWHPSKTALEYLWRSGALSVTRRENFRKVYDLTDRVIPEAVRLCDPSPADSLDALCWGALDRLGFGSESEIRAFWDILRPDEVRDWARAALASGALEPVEITGQDGRRRKALARPGLVEAADRAPEPTGRMRVLSPFDPALRDRARAERLFGFTYRIEIFTPAAERRYGYYVFPLLEGARLIGRTEVVADRATGCLEVKAVWPEPGLRWGAGRQDRFDAALARLGRFCGLSALRHASGWLRAPMM
ncbi:DNA glycosylase AlkZ-like family protein [Cognatishimia sp. F0-27]|uniref:winged helix-turn-helix domain-containing protein n=1 Tax=Cognatishimia sp. F0-27 TaxID=2816855 RepID=UPI001D0C2293|nr:YcaQ family DNA glycosylase [Cognatishimia sp. F0-27]